MIFNILFSDVANLIFLHSGNDCVPGKDYR